MLAVVRRRLGNTVTDLLELAAVGWATVELERGVREHPGRTGRPGPPDTLLGAYSWISADHGVPALALLEPSTEGLLAAHLARFDEGPAVLYLRLRRASFETLLAALVGRGLRVRAGSSSFGPAVLVLDPASTAARALQLVVLQAEPGTIQPMIEQQPVPVRPAAATDAPGIASLFTDEGYPAGASTIDARLARFGAAGGQVLVAEEASELLGFVAVHVMPRFEHDDTIARVLALVVDGSARGRGVGHALMAAADGVARAAGAAFIEVTAAHHRPEARQLFESLGYDATVTVYLRKRL